MDVQHALVKFRLDLAWLRIERQRNCSAEGTIAALYDMSVLATCVLISRTATAVLGSGNVSRFAEESLIILGWAANWKPIEIFLYDWWPWRDAEICTVACQRRGSK